jgi:hypothetical protein
MRCVFVSLPPIQPMKASTSTSIRERELAKVVRGSRESARLVFFLFEFQQLMINIQPSVERSQNIRGCKVEFIQNKTLNTPSCLYNGSSKFKRPVRGQDVSSYALDKIGVLVITDSIKLVARQLRKVINNICLINSGGILGKHGKARKRLPDRKSQLERTKKSEYKWKRFMYDLGSILARCGQAILETTDFAKQCDMAMEKS